MTRKVSESFRNLRGTFVPTFEELQNNLINIWTGHEVIKKKKRIGVCRNL